VVAVIGQPADASAIGISSTDPTLDYDASDELKYGMDSFPLDKGRISAACLSTPVAQSTALRRANHHHRQAFSPQRHRQILFGGMAFGNGEPSDQHHPVADCDAQIAAGALTARSRHPLQPLNYRGSSHSTAGAHSN
jgi:hypothetical protein